jgi:hypothetical protein
MLGQATACRDSGNFIDGKWPGGDNDGMVAI